MFNPKYETMSRAEMSAIQLERMKEIVAYAYENVPFYKKKYDDAGFDPYSIKTLEDVNRIPFTNKVDLRDNYPYGLLAVPKGELLRIHASSGTSGKPTVVCYTKKDMDIWTECCSRLMAAAGVEKEDIVQISFGYGLFTGALGMHQAAENIGCAVIPASSGNTERQVMLMKDLESTVLVCTPSYALYMGEMAEKLGYKKEDLKLRIGLFGSEASTEEMHNEIRKKLNVTTNDNYGLSEIIGPGVSGECELKCGMHINEDHFYPEILNSETFEPIADGEYGELVLTTLTKDGMPVIRYRTKDITALDHSTCECGRTSVRMAKLRGRVDDMLIIRGVNVFPSQIEGVLMKMPEVGGQYEIIVTREGFMDKLEVKVEVANSEIILDFAKLTTLKAQISHNLKTVLQLDVKVTLAEPLSMKRFEGKSQRVTDLRPKT
ncbi:MAG: phenylacetate--CoA ligase [Bacillota bacterium]